MRFFPISLVNKKRYRNVIFASQSKRTSLNSHIPWDDTTDMQEMEKLVRRIEKDGLVWGGGHFCDDLMAEEILDHTKFEIEIKYDSIFITL
uniref:EF1_GNE domain-containing protein n=1 Tax=Onchocerca volvulus TaxID=6282 RepID=A0A8R1XSD3_ONCVO